MIPLAAAVIGALLMWAAFPPLDLGLLAFLAPIPLFWAVRRVESGGTAFVLGFVFGGVFYGTMLWWIFTLGAVAWIPLTFWLATTWGAYTLLIWAFRLWPAGRWWLIAVSGWGLWELLRSLFPFGGFPWGTVGYASGGSPGLIGAVQWIGPNGWSILTIAVAAGASLVIEDRRHWRFLVDPFVVAMLLALAGSLFAPGADGAELRVAIVQGGSPCPQTRCQNENLRIYERHLELTRTIQPGTVDLVVWPENSTGGLYEPAGNPEVRAAIVAEAQRIDAFVFISGTRHVGEDQFLNVNAVFAPTGEVIGEYAKRHPVPFGEYVPLRGLLSFIPQLERVPRDMLRGREAVVFRLPDGIVGSVISFEGAFARSIRDEAQEGAQLMVVATNESSYGESVAPHQLIDMTRVNAAAVGQDLVHAAITGISTFIRADGSVGVETPQLEELVVFETLRFRNAGPTIYTRFGDWLLYVAIVGGIMAVAVPSEGRAEARRAAHG